MKNNILCRCMVVIMLTSMLITSKSYANTIDAQTNDINKIWTIKFNSAIDIENLKNEIVVLNEKEENIPIRIELKEEKKIYIYPPVEGYKNNNVYTLKIGKNIKDKKKKIIKSPKNFIFKVDKENLSYNNANYEYKDIVEKSIQSIVNKISNKEMYSDWEVMALKKNNKEVSDNYLEKIKERIEENRIKQPTDYERTVMVLSALNEKPKNFNGINFLDKIYNNEVIEDQGTNALIFALIALDCKNYEIPNNSFWSRESLVNTLLEMKTYDGGWDFAGIKADPDMTGMALTALHNYTDDGKVKDAVNNAIKLLSDMQNDDGTFSSYKIKNSESISQVIIGLCANGIDPTSSEFTKNGKNLIDALLTFKSDDGGFKHIYEGNSNGKATEQALLALEAYKELKNGRLNLYEF